MCDSKKTIALICLFIALSIFVSGCTSNQLDNLESAATLTPIPPITPTETETSSPPTSTPNSATALPSQDSSFSGSVILEDDRCCAGGIAGETIEIHAAFSASSPFGAVSEMRVSDAGGCATDEIMEEIAWEPFVAEKNFPFEVFINWIPFDVSVQYRDELGNLSPIYCDDISVEGMPPPPEE